MNFEVFFILSIFLRKQHSSIITLG